MKTIRDWGSYTITEVGKDYKVKRIEVIPEKAISLQRHTHRAEHWIVVSGVAKVIKGDKEYFLKPNESIYIDILEIHKIYNIGKIPLIFIEVQTGEYLEEDDIERFD